MASVALRASGWALAIAGVAVAISWMRSIKSAPEERFVAPPLSIEVVRDRVQHGIDTEVAKVVRQPSELTLAQLRAQKRPSDLDADHSKYADGRIAPFETHVWKIQAHVVSVVERPDGDIYLVIEQSGIRAVAEVPPSHLSGSSPFRSDIERLRMSLDRELRPALSPKTVDRDAELVGVGFFGTASSRDNGARLLPLLDIRWRR